MNLKSKTLAVLTFFAVSGAQATILTYNDLNLTNYGTIPITYGDHVASAGSAPNGSYLIGSGWTPNIGLEASTVDGVGGLLSNHLDFWDTGYGNLTNVAFASASGYFARIKLKPDSGYAVKLESFDLAGWPQSNLTAVRIRVIDINGTELWTAPSLTVLGAGGTHSSYSPNILSNSALTIEFGTNWNIGIDNVRFSQTSAVPEPAAFLGLSLLGLIAFRRKK